MRNKPKGAVVYGVDIGKNRFDVAGLDTTGSVIERLKFRRDTLLAFFAAAPAATVGMEACAGSQWLARQLQAFGHRVRIIPAQFVRPVSGAAAPRRGSRLRSAADQAASEMAFGA